MMDAEERSKKPIALTPDMYEDIRKGAQEFVGERREAGQIKSPEDERLDRQAYIEAMMEIWPQFKPIVQDAIKRKRLEISLRGDRGETIG